VADVFGRRKDEVFLQRKALLEPCGLTRFATNHWEAYSRRLDPEGHGPGQRHPQHIERGHQTLRMRITQPVRKTICVARSTQRHENVNGLFIHREAFARAVDIWPSPLCAHSPPRSQEPDEGVTTCGTHCRHGTVTR